MRGWLVEFVFVFYVSPIAGSQVNISSDRLEKPRIEPVIPDLQGEWSTQYTTFAPWLLHFNCDVAV